MTTDFDDEITLFQQVQVGMMMGWLNLWDVSLSGGGSSMAWMGAGDDDHAAMGHEAGSQGMPGMASQEDLRRLLGDRFDVERVVTYSGTFSELVDTALNGLNELRRGKARGTQATRKGTVVTAADLNKRQKEFRLLSAIYPVLWAVSRLDRLLSGQSGYKLILRARRRPAATAG